MMRHNDEKRIGIHMCFYSELDGNLAYLISVSLQKLRIANFIFVEF